MDYNESSLIIKSAQEKLLDEKIWQRWLIDIQGMDDNNFLGFDEYKKQLFKKAEIMSKTDERRNIDFIEAEKKAQMALEKLNKNNDLGQTSKKAEN